VAEALVAACTEEATATRLRAAGLQRAAGLSWSATVEAVDAVLAGARSRL
jgi:hypothetical protein